MGRTAGGDMEEQKRWARERARAHSADEAAFHVAVQPAAALLQSAARSSRASGVHELLVAARAAGAGCTVECAADGAEGDGGYRGREGTVSVAVLHDGRRSQLRIQCERVRGPLPRRGQDGAHSVALAVEYHRAAATRWMLRGDDGDFSKIDGDTAERGEAPAD